MGRSKSGINNILRQSWQIIVGFSVILAIIVSVVYLNETRIVDMGLGASTFVSFLSTPIPLYLLILLVIALLSVYYGVRAFPSRDAILDLSDARKLVRLCEQPRTTEFLRSNYDAWQQQSSVAVIGGYNFDDYMKKLEKEGHLKFMNGNWRATRKAMRIIEKYHGD